MDKVTLRFIVDDKEIKIQGNKDDKLDEIFKKFLKESKNNNQIIDFYHNGDRIAENKQNLKIEDINNNDNEITFVVKEKKFNNFLNSSIQPAPLLVPIKEIKHSKDIICPVCKKCCICPKCRKLYCLKCRYSCEQCKNKFCKYCLFNCNICSKYFCSKCLKGCTICQNLHCYICGNNCYICNQNLCNKCNSFKNGEHFTKCTTCNKVICVECSIECETCNEKICKNCFFHCKKCNKRICFYCLKPCGFCFKNFCKKCYSDFEKMKCEFCNKILCNNCISNIIKCEKCKKKVCKDCFIQCFQCKSYNCKKCIKKCSNCNNKICIKCQNKCLCGLVIFCGDCLLSNKEVSPHECTQFINGKSNFNIGKAISTIKLNKSFEAKFLLEKKNIEGKTLIGISDIDENIFLNEIKGENYDILALEVGGGEIYSKKNHDIFLESEIKEKDFIYLMVKYDKLYFKINNGEYKFAFNLEKKDYYIYLENNNDKNCSNIKFIFIREIENI